ncbi:MAG: hypothetical protein ACE15C_13005 [Phycisphaerae bacterium]
MVKCATCGREFDRRKEKQPAAAICVEVMGDEYIFSFFFRGDTNWASRRPTAIWPSSRPASPDERACTLKDGQLELAVCLADHPDTEESSGYFSDREIWEVLSQAIQ